MLRFIRPQVPTRALCSVNKALFSEKLPKAVLENKMLAQKQIPDSSSKIDFLTAPVISTSAFGSAKLRLDTMKSLSTISSEWKYLARVVKVREYQTFRFALPITADRLGVEFSARVTVDDDLNENTMLVGSEVINKFNVIFDHEKKLLIVDDKEANLMQIPDEEFEKFKSTLKLDWRQWFGSWNVYFRAFLIKFFTFRSSKAKSLLKMIDQIESLFTINIKIYETQFVGVLNTASDYCFISEALAIKCNLDHLIDYTDTMDENYIGKIHCVDIMVDNVKLKTSFYVLHNRVQVDLVDTDTGELGEEMLLDCYLGFGLMKRYKSLLDFKNMQLSFKLKNANAKISKHTYIVEN